MPPFKCYLRRHHSLSDGQGVILSLCHDGHNCVLPHRRHLGIRMGQTRAHDVGPGQNKFDGTFVYSLVRKDERVLVQQLEGGTPSALSLPEEEKLTSRVDLFGYVIK